MVTSLERGIQAFRELVEDTEGLSPWSVDDEVRRPPYLVHILLVKPLKPTVAKYLATLWSARLDIAAYPRQDDKGFVVWLFDYEDPSVQIRRAWTQFLDMTDDLLRDRPHEAAKYGVTERVLDNLRTSGPTITIFVVGAKYFRTHGQAWSHLTSQRAYVTNVALGNTAINESQQSLPDFIEHLRDGLQADPALLEISSPPSELVDTFLQQQTRIGRERVGALGMVALRTLQAEALKASLDSLVDEARDLGATWSDIGRAAGITPQAAHRRWDDVARQKHTDYERARRQPQRSEDDSSE